VVLALSTIYLIWGSTYLAIRFAIATLPPFLMAGVRFLLAGSLLYALARWRGAKPPRKVHWRSACLVGGLLLLGGNGAVVWAEQRVASGLTALLIAMVPLWMVLLEWARRGGRRPSSRVFLGIALGFGGLGLLVGPQHLASSGRVDPVGAAVLVFATLSWASGSLLARHLEMPPSPLLTTAMEMLAGGALLLAASGLAREWTAIRLADVSLRSLLSVAYLVVFGSLVAFTAYGWLLRVSTPALVGTYAYVNPVVAVFLGWALAGEPLPLRTIVAATVIVTAVVVITTERLHAPPSRPATGAPPAPGPIAGPGCSADIS
jgi:drug/metabolite transporter (DMT)-like permease